MGAQRFFCAAESRIHGEAIFGTVARIRSWLLLEYPEIWRRNAIEDSRLLSPALKSHIASLRVDRALLIRQSHKCDGPLNCFFVRSCDDPPTSTRHLLNDYEDLRELRGDGQLINQLMFAVCTHGRHDKCCAKFGVPVWCAFRELAGSRAWQCSHVGGDRFAGNVVVFPYGIYYGRVNPDDVSQIIHRSEAGEIWLPGYRGRSCHSRILQAADYFVRRESGRLRIDEFEPIDATRLPGDVTRVRLRARSDATQHTIDFLTRRDALQQRLTCDSAEASEVTQYELLSYVVGER